MEPQAKGTQDLPPTQWERMSWLVEQLRSGRCPGRNELARKLEVDVRTVQRLITFLRDRLGAPIVYDAQAKGYRLTETTWFLPRVSLTEGELFSLLVARQAMALYRGTPVEQSLDRVFRKVAGELVDRISVHPEVGNRNVLSFAPTPVLPIHEAVWNALLSAARSRQRVRIRYRSQRSRTTADRLVNPYHILNMQGDWYLFAHDQRHGKVCQFQLHRIESATLLSETFTPDPDFQPETLVSQTFGSFGDAGQPVTLRLQVRGEIAALMADRIYHPMQQVIPLADGFELSFPISAAGDRPFFHVLPWILGMGREVTVLAPAALQALIRSELAAMQTACLPDA